MGKFKNTKKLTLVNVAIVLLVGMLVFGISAKLIGFFGGEQETEINVDGEEIYLTFDSEPMNDLAIPGDNVGTISAGTTKTFTHYCNLSSSAPNNVKIFFDIDDAWFNSVNHDKYGLTYGVTYMGSEIANTEQYCGLGPGDNKVVTFWYTVDEDMMTPINPVFTHTWVNATEVVT